MMTGAMFADRLDAGIKLGEELAGKFTLKPDTIVLGLVRGGAVVAQSLARTINLAWDILIVRKIGAPYQPEYAVGAYAESGSFSVNHAAASQLGLADQWLERSKTSAAAACDKLHFDLRGNKPRPELLDCEVILTDDGMATGLSMKVAIDAVQSSGASRLIVAVPVLSPDARTLLERLKVEHCYLACPPDFHAVGQFYANFTPVSSDEVRVLLAMRPDEGEIQ